MAITYSFVDSAVYGPEDVNDITRSLVGAGVAPFVSKSSYNVSDLNAMTSALVGTGVQLDGCKCSVENAGTEEMTITVAQGIVFFESGVRLVVDEEGYSFYITPNQAGYVYAHYSSALQKAEIVFDSELPTDGEHVVLAKVLSDGSIQDTRAFARSKVATLGRNLIFTTAFTYKSAPVYDEETELYEYASVEEVDLSGFDYAIISALNATNISDKPYGVFNLGKNLFEACILNEDWAEFDKNRIFYRRSGENYYVKLINGKLTLKSEYKRMPTIAFEIRLV